MLDIVMIAVFILLTSLMIGVSAWAGNVVEEGSGNK